eukprot:COSAG04_NODE_4846_length_1864_cov_2.002833_2_plen_110_part_00
MKQQLPASPFAYEEAIYCAANESGGAHGIIEDSIIRNSLAGCSGGAIFVWSGNEVGWPFVNHHDYPRYNFFKNASCRDLNHPGGLRELWECLHNPKNWHIYKVNQLATK